MKFWVSLMVTVFTGLFAGADEGDFGKASVESYRDKVVILKVGEDSLMNKYAFKYFQKVIKRADEEKARAVVFDIDSPGGYAFETAELITRDMQGLDVRSIAFVNPSALSAASWVAWGCDAIYMHPHGQIGSSAVVSGTGAEIEPVMRSKIESSLRSYVEIVAKEKKRDPEVMFAMMFKDKEYRFGELVVEEGDLLNLTAEKAMMEYEGRPLLATGIAESLEEVLNAEGLADVKTVVAEPRGMEAFAFWVAKFSAILIGIGLLGAFLEMKTPGFGLFGGLALGAFALFFFGNNVAGNLAGYELAVLFVAGLILVILEFLVIPGTFFAGAIGVLMMLSALVMAMVDREFFRDFKRDGDGLVTAGTLIGWPVVALAIGLTVAVVLGALLIRFLPSVPMYRRLAIDEQLKRGSGIVARVETSELVGKVGKVVAELRPAGKVEIDGVYLDVESRMGFIDEGEQVRVISVDGMRVLVESV